MSPATLRAWIVRCLGVGAALLVPLAVAGVLWGALAALGDSGGARVAKGITLGAFLCWGVDLVALVVLLALAQMTQPDGPSRASPAEENESPP